MNESVARHPAVEAYLNAVCSQIKAKEMHDEIKLEMTNHLEEIVEDKMKREGTEREAAIAAAIEQMGDPAQAGKGLHAAHKPRTEWSLIGLLAILVGFAIVSLIAVHAVAGDRYSFGPRLVYGFAGLAAMAALYFVDYRKLLRYSWHLYGGTLLLLAAAQLQGIQVNGASKWLGFGNLYLNVYAVSPYLLLIAIAGTIQLRAQREKARETQAANWRKLLLEGLAYGVLPSFFYFTAPDLASFVIYTVGLFALLAVTGHMKLLIAAFAALGAAVLAFAAAMLEGPRFAYFWSRIAAVFQPGSDGNYAANLSVEAIRSGGMWGQGSGASDFSLPFVYSEFLFSYLVHSQGWIFGTALAAVMLLLAARMMRVGMKLREGYANKLAIAVTSVVAARLVWNILMCLGLLPIMGTELPVMVWSSGTFVEFAAIGLVLSAYRRKDMIRTVPEATPAV
jgi:Bacterial cell division membrane protein